MCGCSLVGVGVRWWVAGVCGSLAGFAGVCRGLPVLPRFVTACAVLLCVCGADLRVLILFLCCPLVCLGVVWFVLNLPVKKKSLYMHIDE